MVLGCCTSRTATTRTDWKHLGSTPEQSINRNKEIKQINRVENYKDEKRYVVRTPNVIRQNVENQIVL